MPSPLFNEEPIFDSLIGLDSAGEEVLMSEGCLDVAEYSGILQPLHFNGEDGMRYLGHGWPDRQWIYQGVLSAPSLAALKAKLGAIQTYADESQEGTYRALVTSFGQTFDEAQIHRLSRKPLQKSQDGYLTEIIVQGIIRGMPHG